VFTNHNPNILGVLYIRDNYNKENIKFQGDIPCIAYILNLVIQDILKQ
jgi:hypothetical protein